MPYPTYEGNYWDRMNRWDAIRVDAYFRWQRAGCPDNRDLEFWLEAEKTYHERKYREYTQHHCPVSIGL